MAKTRRDNWRTHRERRIHGVEDGESGRGTLPGLRPEIDGQVIRPTNWMASVFKPAEAGTRLEVHPHLSEYFCSYQGTGLLPPVQRGDELGA